MLTLFTIPKAFQGHAGLIQNNALGKLRRLRPACSIILCGNDAGTAEAAQELGASYLPEIARNALGTPLLDSAFAEACRAAPTRLVCYSNSDIIFLDDFLQAIERVTLENFLLIGERTTVDLREPIDFSDPRWSDKLRELAKTTGHPDGPTAIDYMVFPR